MAGEFSGARRLARTGITLVLIAAVPISCGKLRSLEDVHAARFDEELLAPPAHRKSLELTVSVIDSESGAPWVGWAKTLEARGAEILAESGYFSGVGTTNVATDPELSDPELMLTLNFEVDWTPNLLGAFTLFILPLYVVHHWTGTGDFCSADGPKLAELEFKSDLTEMLWVALAPTLGITYWLTDKRHIEDVFHSVLVQLIEQGAI